MKYTAGELRKMNGRKCKLQYGGKPEAEGEIYVKDGAVGFVTDNEAYSKGIGKKKDGYKYSWLLYEGYNADNCNDSDHDSITFTEEAQPTSIYHDDNGEIIREGDWVLVGDQTPNFKRIFLCKVPKAVKAYISVGDEDNSLYGYSPVRWANWGKCIKYKEPERKLRQIRATDEEREVFQKKNNIQ